MKIAVIGAGAAGTSYLFHKRNELAADEAGGALAKHLEITVYEKSKYVGAGTAYSRDLNLPTDTMNLQADELFRNARALYCEWLAEQPDERLKSLGYIQMMERQAPDVLKEYRKGGKTIAELLGARGYDIDPRIATGAFLGDVFQEAVDDLRAMGAKVTVATNTEVIGYKPGSGDKQHTLIAEGRLNGKVTSEDVDDFLMSTGYWKKPVPQDKEGVFYDGFPAEEIIEKADVTQPNAQLGTAVFGGEMPVKVAEKAGTFTRDENGRLRFTRHPGNEKFKFVMFSGSGYLSAVKGRTTNYQPAYITPEAIQELIHDNNGFLPLDDFIDLFKKEIAHAAPELAKAVPGWEKFKIEDIAALLTRHRDAMGPRNRLKQDLEFAQESRAPDNLKPIPWQNPLMLMFVFGDQYLHALSAEDRIRYNEAAPTLFKDIELITVPTAERLKAMMDATPPALEVVKVHDFKIDVDDGSQRGSTVAYKDANENEHSDHFNTFIQAGSGSHPDIRQNPSRFTQSLLENNLIAPGFSEFRDQQLGHNFFEGHTQLDKPYDDVAQDGAEANYSTLAGRVVRIGGKYHLNTGGIYIDSEGRVIAPPDLGKEPSDSHSIYAVLPDKKGNHPMGGGLTIGSVMSGKVAKLTTNKLRQELITQYRPNSGRSREVGK